MKWRLGGLALALALGIITMFGALPLGGSATAARPVEGCGGEEEVEGFPATLTITVSGSGSVKRGTATLCENSDPGDEVCEIIYEEGEEVDLSAAPGAGQTFTGWSGSCSGTGACSLTMDEDRSVEAFFVDNTPPVPPTITVPTEGQEIELDPTEQTFVGFNNSLDPSAVSFLCRLDLNAPFGASPCNSPWATGPLSAGEHTIYVWAKDAADNISDPAVRKFKVVRPSEPGPTDADGDGYSPPEDCDDSSPAVHPGAVDTPGDGIDQDCSGADAVTPSGGGQPTAAGSGASGGAGGGSLSGPVQVDAAVRAKWKVTGAVTSVRKLVVTTVPGDALVSLSCKGRGCPFKRKQVTARNGSAKLTGMFAGAELVKGTVIKLAVTGPQGGLKTITVKVRDGKPPKVSISG